MREGGEGGRKGGGGGGIEGGERNGVCVCVCVKERERDCSTTLYGRNHSIGYCTSSPNTHTDDLLSMMTQKPNKYMYM